MRLFVKVFMHALVQAGREGRTVRYFSRREVDLLKTKRARLDRSLDHPTD